MNNKQIKYYLKRLASIKKRYRENLRKQTRLATQIQRDYDIINTLEIYPTKIECYKGVYLDVNIHDSIYGKDCDVHPIDDSNSRYAEVYQNAHNRKTWGCHLKKYGANDHETWLGADWEDFNEICTQAKEWVATGKRSKKRI